MTPPVPADDVDARRRAAIKVRRIHEDMDATQKFNAMKR